MLGAYRLGRQNLETYKPTDQREKRSRQDERLKSKLRNPKPHMTKPKSESIRTPGPMLLELRIRV